ncbi:hypothetical protein [Sphingobium fuliginis]|uniref:Uncharacterized protein n=1 Tax=Sphingobium fuliginis ATCC 27551 TaxID=1208342 RepID=A0A5B8CKR6_SPHSA|nr:hypothetical protein [Sphingobium fuliginis]QDC39425.1 hypothetical protein FIL70_19525 [Sphingobium fuliginis ATCC 27551]
MPTSEFFREQAELWERRAGAEMSRHAQDAALAAARKWHDDANFAEMMTIGLVATPQPETLVDQPVIKA